MEKKLMPSSVLDNAVLFEAIKAALCGKTVSCEQKQVDRLMEIAKKHDVAHLASAGFGNASFKKDVLEAVYRHEQMKYEYDRLCACLEKAEIPYMPLKGAVIRLLYPEEWMRTSCDIDILVNESDLKKAVDALVRTGDWETDGKREYHDMSLYSKSGVHLELHFNIMENMANIDTLLSSVWEHSVRDADGYRYSQTNEFFVFHHIAHMSYHFISGGCGIKPFIDLYLIKSKMQYDGDTLREYCKSCGIETFYDNMLYVTDVWFSSAPHTETSRRIEEYVLRGGVYGSLENRVVLAQTKKGGKAGYIFSRLFLPYNALKYQYPILKKHKWLMPFMQVARWFRFLKKGEFDRSINEIKINGSVTKNEAESVRRFLSDIGLLH